MCRYFLKILSKKGKYFHILTGLIPTETIVYEKNVCLFLIYSIVVHKYIHSFSYI